MMNDQQHEAARLDRQILDEVLIALGRRPVVENPDFQEGDPVLPGAKPWIQLRVRALGLASTLEPNYAPYVQTRSE